MEIHKDIKNFLVQYLPLLAKAEVLSNGSCLILLEKGFKSTLSFRTVGAVDIVLALVLTFDLQDKSSTQIRGINATVVRISIFMLYKMSVSSFRS